MEMDRSFTRQLPMPWVLESPFTRELLVDHDINGKSRFFLYDPWHAIHLGVGKIWAACGIIMLTELITESNMEKRMAYISQLYRAFCRSNKLDPILRKIDLRTFGTVAEPVGNWSKAAVTSNMLLFIENFCMDHSEMIQSNERLRIYVSLSC